MAYQDELRNQDGNPVPGGRLGYENRPSGSGGTIGLVLGALVLLLVIGLFAFGGSDDAMDQPAQQQAAPSLVAPTDGATAPAPDAAPADAAPAPVAPAN